MKRGWAWHASRAPGRCARHLRARGVTLSKSFRSPNRLSQLRAWARAQRRSPTAPEHILWLALRGKALGVAFRRQVVLGEAIVDFLASSRKVIVEVDGAFHAQRASLDARREARLRRKGYRVVRVGAQEVLGSLPAVLGTIAKALGP